MGRFQNDEITSDFITDAVMSVSSLTSLGEVNDRVSDYQIPRLFSRQVPPRSPGAVSLLSQGEGRTIRLFKASQEGSGAVLKATASISGHSSPFNLVLPISQLLCDIRGPPEI